MYKISVKKIFARLVQKALSKPVKAIKKSSIVLDNIIITNSDKINPRIVFEKKDNNIIRILLLNDGNFLLFKYFSLSNLEIISGQTYQRIKLIKHDKKPDFTDAILTSKKRNEILLCNYLFAFKYIEFDDNYKIKNSFFKNYQNKEGSLYFSCLTLLKNEKIVYKGYKSSTNNEEAMNFGLAKIYILRLDRINKDIIMEFKINAFKCCFYEIKSKNEYLVNLKKDYISVINSNNYRTKKSFKFYYDDNKIMKLLNDKFFIQAGGNNELNLYSLDNFQLVKTFLTSNHNEIFNIFIFGSCFLTCEILQYSQDIYYIKKWKFDEEKNEIISLGFFKLDKKMKYESIIKLKENEDLFLFRIFDGYRIIEIPNKK